MNISRLKNKQKKIHSITTMFCLVLSFASAQNVKVKKDVVIVDGEERFKVDGKASINQGTNLQFNSLDDKRLFTLEEAHYQTGIPTLSEMQWQKISFQGSDHYVKSNLEKLSNNKKNVIRSLLENFPELLNADQNWKEQMDILLDKYNASTKVLDEDSTRLAIQMETIKTALNDGKDVPRNKGKEMVFSEVDFTATTRKSGLLRVYSLVEKIQISQDGLVIGYITKEKDIKFPNSTKRRYMV